MSSGAWQFGLACGLAGAGDVWPCSPTPLEAELSWPFGRPMDFGAGELACGNGRLDLWQRDMDEGALRNPRLLITYTCPNPLAHLPILTHINTQVRTLSPFGLNVEMQLTLGRPYCTTQCSHI